MGMLTSNADETITSALFVHLQLRHRSSEYGHFGVIGEHLSDYDLIMIQSDPIR